MARVYLEITVRYKRVYAVQCEKGELRHAIARGLSYANEAIAAELVAGFLTNEMRIEREAIGIEVSPVHDS